MAVEFTPSRHVLLMQHQPAATTSPRETKQRRTSIPEECDTSCHAHNMDASHSFSYLMWPLCPANTSPSNLRWQGCLSYIVELTPTICQWRATRAVLVQPYSEGICATTANRLVSVSVYKQAATVKWANCRLFTLSTILFVLLLRYMLWRLPPTSRPWAKGKEVIKRRMYFPDSWPLNPGQLTEPFNFTLQKVYMTHQLHSSQVIFHIQVVTDEWIRKQYTMRWLHFLNWSLIKFIRQKKINLQ